MRRIAYLIIMTALLLCSCIERNDRMKLSNQPCLNVAVMYSYDSLMQCYTQYDETLRAEFRKAGLNVRIHNLYLDNPDFDLGAANRNELIKELRSEKFDLFITEGNPACYEAVYVRSLIGDSVPMICGGVTAPDWKFLRRDRNVYVWNYDPYYSFILADIKRLMKTNLVMVELDYGYQDSLLEANIHEALRPIRFVDFVKKPDSRVFSISSNSTAFGDSLVVFSHSLASPEENGLGSFQEAQENIIGMMSQFPYLVVKFDEYSLNAVHISPLPSFTCLPYTFGTPGNQFLVGYFVSMDTEARDVASTAIPVLRGEAEHVIPGGHHSARAYMDYNVMQGCGLSLADVGDRYHVINIPTEVTDPLFGNTTHVAILLGCILLGIVLLYFILWRYHENLLKRLKGLTPDNFRMLSNHTSVFHYLEGGEIEIDTYNQGEDTQHVCFDVEKFFSVVMPESKAAAEEFEKGLHEPGQYSVDMNVSFNKGIDCHWWRYRFITEYNALRRKHETYGVLMMIDGEVQRREELQRTREMVREMESRENFLHSMNHEIRTPLNIVLGCSQLLAMPEVLEDEVEQARLLANMKSASEQLMELVQDILNYSRIGSGRMHFQLEPMGVEEIMQSLFAIYSKHFQRNPLIDENNVDKTGKLTLQLVCGARGLTVNVDNECMQQVFHHLLSNAIKFTDEGEIRMGWTFHLTEGEVEFFVEDSGHGIDPDRLRQLWGAFFKNDTCSNGVGLGLTLVKTMVEKMGGRVGCESRLGVGSRFSIYFAVQVPGQPD